ncbi:MAG TPA: acetoacetate decarboxylase family protein [Gemmatimonadales bacterium]|nr:acetoacetate decarboxylase family protein [Gemmatimonadales bacterium]
MAGPARLRQQAGRHALVDGIPFTLPVTCTPSPALMAAFPINPERAAALLAGNEVHPFRLWNRGLLVITVIDYLSTNIGTYIEFSIAIACTHGRRPAPRLLPALLMRHYGTGQCVIDLPVSTEISVKGGKGIWGMPKHRANLDFTVGDRVVSSQYDLDGELAMRIEIDRPARTWLPVNVGTANYCAFRGLLMKSYIYFRGHLGMGLLGKARARLTLGDHPRLAPLRQLEIAPKPLFTAFIPDAIGVLDDHFESWFLSFPQPPTGPPEGMESVVDLGLGEEWLPPPVAAR